MLVRGFAVQDARTYFPPSYCMQSRMRRRKQIRAYTGDTLAHTVTGKASLAASRELPCLHASCFLVLASTWLLLRFGPRILGGSRCPSRCRRLETTSTTRPCRHFSMTTSAKRYCLDAEEKRFSLNDIGHPAPPPFGSLYRRARSPFRAGLSNCTERNLITKLQMHMLFTA